MAKIRTVDFTSDIIKGETVVFKFDVDSKVVVIDSVSVQTEYTYPYQKEDTSTWIDGAYTAIIYDSKGMIVRTFRVTDPTATATRFNQLKKIIEEIDIVIENKMMGGGVIQQSINNKSLTMESMDSLLKLRSQYIKQANGELAKMKGLNPGNPIKSISTFNRGQ